MARYGTRWSAAAAFIGLVLFPLPSIVGAEAHRTRPGAAHRQGGGGSSAPAPRRHAQGKATYGRGGRAVFTPYGGWVYLGSPRWYGPVWGWYDLPYTWGVRGGPYGPGPRASGEDGGGSAMVETDVVPHRAWVRVDGESIGIAKDFNGSWDVLRVDPGLHVLEFGRDGYQTLRIHIEARSGYSYQVDQVLRRGDGIDSRSTTGPPGPRIRRGRADDRRDHEDGEGPRARTWDRGDDAVGDTRWRGRGPRRDPESQEDADVPRGHLHLHVQPADAAVYLDGDFLGRAGELRRLHGSVAVSEGRHRVEVVRPGFRSASEAVEVEAGSLVEVRIDLDPTTDREEGGEDQDEEEEEDDRVL